jgi:hypothetical protein
MGQTQSSSGAREKAIEANQNKSVLTFNKEMPKGNQEALKMQGADAVFGSDTSNAYGENLASQYGSVVVAEPEEKNTNVFIVVIVFLILFIISSSIGGGGAFYYTQSKK